MLDLYRLLFSIYFPSLKIKKINLVSIEQYNFPPLSNYNDHIGNHLYLKAEVRILKIRMKPKNEKRLLFSSVCPQIYKIIMIYNIGYVCMPVGR
mgnify:CR=1 FL=1